MFVCGFKDEVMMALLTASPSPAPPDKRKQSLNDEILDYGKILSRMLRIYFQTKNRKTDVPR